MARALALHARGRRFDSDILHKKKAYQRISFKNEIQEMTTRVVKKKEGRTLTSHYSHIDGNQGILSDTESHREKVL